MTEYDAWAPDYDEWASDMTEDVALLRLSSRGEADGPIVELTVGNGRVAIPVARETGKRVLGIDSSPAMLEIARERAAGLPLELRWATSASSSSRSPRHSSTVPFRSLLHLHEWQDKRRVFERVAASLRPGGRFAFNAFASATRSQRELDGTTQDQSGVVHTLRVRPADNRIDIRARRRRDDPPLVGDEVRVGRPDRRRRARGRGALRRLRPASRSTTSRSSSSTSRGSR